MSWQATIQVSEQVIHQAAQVAAQTHRSVEDVLAAWLERETPERPVEELSDDETSYLLRSPANRARLLQAVADVERSQNIIEPEQERS
jgi:hypothetical protein